MNGAGGEKNDAKDFAAPSVAGNAKRLGSPLEVFRVFLKLGVSSFGGPIAHIGYYREEFVVRRRWLDEEAFVDLVALCQFLPGPASSQVGFSIGLMRAGYAGAAAGRRADLRSCGGRSSMRHCSMNAVTPITISAPQARL